MKKFFCLMLALLMVLCSVSAMAEMAGGWTIPEETFPDDDAFDAFSAAAGEDSDLLPQVVLGTQVVAGINYAFLCDAPIGWEVVYVTHSVSGEDALAREQVLAEMDREVAGGWNKLGEEGITPETLDLIGTAFDDMTGIGVSEYIVMGKQVVAGTNYMLMCRVTTVTAEPTEHWAVAVVYVDLEGKASVIDMQDVELSLFAE